QNADAWTEFINKILLIHVLEVNRDAGNLMILIFINDFAFANSWQVHPQILCSKKCLDNFIVHHKHAVMALTPSTMLALGTPAPDFRLPNVDGTTVTRDDFKGKSAL